MVISTSSAEVECGALFYDYKELETLMENLKEMGHPQLSTQIITDNSTSYEIMKVTITHKHTKAMDMRFYLVRDLTEQRNYDVKWNPGNMNFRDYFTKHQPQTHHRIMWQK